MRLRAFAWIGMCLGCAATNRAHRLNSTAFDCRFPADPADTTVYDTTQVGATAYAINGPQLRYPEGPRDRDIQGRVLVSFIIDTSGRAEPQSIAVVQSLQVDLDHEAVRFVSLGSFRRMCIAGRPVRVRTTLPVDFKIKRSR